MPLGFHFTNVRERTWHVLHIVTRVRKLWVTIQEAIAIMIVANIASIVMRILINNIAIIIVSLGAGGVGGHEGGNVDPA